MKSLLMLWNSVLDESGTRCGTSTIRDCKTVAERYEHEGLSFLTITLSKFGKALEKALDQGFVAHDQFPGFSRSGGLPRFLGGFLELVFNRLDGRLLDCPSVESIRCLRQLTLMMGKIEIDCSPRRTAMALQKYVECEEHVRQSDLRTLTFSKPYGLEEFASVGRLLWAPLFSRIDSRVYHDGVVPKHGPGATADKLRGNAKYNNLSWTRRLDDVFPMWENIVPTQSPSSLERLERVTCSEPGTEMAVKVITVPKTLETPRIIAVEPTSMQCMQQGILAVMVEEIARSDNARNLVMFESQEPNKRLARKGSITGALATLDLSEASDRVSNQHVRLLLANHGPLARAVDATRSRKAEVPGHGVIRLAKFASMGSALCFPFEALVFTTAIFVGIQHELRRRLTQKDIESFYGLVRVYGDDIIIPVEYVQCVVESLETFGFRVNLGKSFWTGKFRESCGGDYYDGHDVSIVRCRKVLPITRRDGEALESVVALRNNLHHAGWSEPVAHLDNLIGRLIPFPVVGCDSVLLGRHGDWRDSETLYHDNDLQYPLVKGVQAVPIPTASPLDGVGALMKWMLSAERKELPFEDSEHLAFAGRVRSVRIKNRMARPF